LAPTLLVGTVYGMHFNHMPELHRLLGYPLALLLMLVSSVSLHAKGPLVFLIKSEIELHHHVQGYTSEGQ
jgi:CorA-like Mg2+ transporter protein